MQANHFFTIPAGAPFADILARQVWEWHGQNSTRLARTIIFLPNRRSCQTLKEAFFRVGDGKPVILPRIQPLGDEDIDPLLAEFLYRGADTKPLPEPMPPLSRLGHLRRRIQDYFDQKGMRLNDSQAFGLAENLAALLDRLEREEIAFDKIKGLVPLDYAEHWQVSLDLLTILLEWWPQYLAREQKMDGVARRNSILRLLAERWRQVPPDYPVIIAGTTGSIPATASLVRVVAALPEGRVVLPGLDLDMEEAAWESLDSTHPQWGMKKLLVGCGVSPSEVASLGDARGCTHRRRLLSDALLPVERVVSWGRDTNLDTDKAIEGLHYLECEDEEAESLTVSLLLREALEHAGKNALLVTNDRQLAQRVVGHLGGLGIAIDDSAGQPFVKTPAARLLLHLFDVFIEPRGAVHLLSLLKHPLCRFGERAARVRGFARWLEINLLRGKGFTTLDDVFARASRLESLPDDYRPLLNKLIALYQEHLPDGKAISLEAMITKHEALFEQAIFDDGMEDGGEELPRDILQVQTLLAAFRASLHELGRIDAPAYREMLVGQLATALYYPRTNPHPRLQIASPMEARMLMADRVVLAGVNEDNWPGLATHNPWLSLGMQKQVGLPGHAEQVGLAAHDFYMLAMAREVYVTRTKKKQGAGMRPNRWIQRIEALLAARGKNAETWKAQSAHWMHWARAWHASDADIILGHPEPRPPVELRPREYAASHIEKLMRDPYAFYAEKILKLKPLDEMEVEPGAADFGQAFHLALQRFSEAYPEQLPVHAKEELLRIGKEVFAALPNHSRVHVFWWPRFEMLAEKIIAAEHEIRTGDFAHVQCEEKLSHIYPECHMVTLTAKADRIEQYADGGVAIVDYKTGAPPAVGEVGLGLSPQLTVEGFLYEDAKQQNVRWLRYWKLGGSGEDLEIKAALGEKVVDVSAHILAARKGCLKLIDYFLSSDTPYLAMPHADYELRFNPYRHLARVDEWGF